ncbi:Predicted dehydrogenase [Daejeonella rubra]|uniref:Predicted dehydrogenase n=1 Tax=Daejeonella rubra TaxID=990371 RepID=A0A1G9V6N3_9SPHI|nr:Gfo/Idh/MocA family oxidoreductase [Daejeonella rubra]SDM67726.1 Predicted dehydrogenase [Daejeonella rubra]
MKTTDKSRRKFIATGALALSGLTAFGYQGISLSDLGQTGPIRIGLIGSGSRGQGLASLLSKIQGFELIACCDIIPENLQGGMKLAAKGARSYTDYKKLLQDKDIQAVIIATPLYLHYPMAVDAIAAGKHIYMEKTMAYTIPQALDLVKRVERSNLVFQVGHQYRYYSMYLKVKEILSQGWIGKVSHYECQYNRNSDWRKPVSDPKMERAINWRMYKEYCGGVLSELSAHEIDIVNWMEDSHPLKVAGFGGIDYWKDGRETFDNIRLVYEYPGGVKASVTSILSNEYKGYSIRILGSKGTIEILRDQAYIYPEATKKTLGTVDGVTGATIEVLPGGKGQPIVFEKQLDPTSYALQDFAECILKGKKPASNVNNGRDVAIAVHMGNQAAETEKTQYWKDEYSV